MVVSFVKKRERNAWIVIDRGMVYVTMGDSYERSFSKPFEFAPPEEFPMENGGALAHFVAGCLAKCGVTKGKVALLLGEGVSFYEEYVVNPQSAKLREEQRSLALEKALGDAAASLVEDLKVAEGNGLSTLAVCGTDYDFLSEFTKILKKYGYVVDFASRKAPVAAPDFLYGGRESRRFGRVTTLLCACVVIAVVAVALFPPVQAVLAKSDASRYVEEVRGAGQGEYYEMLEQYRGLQRLLPEVREAGRALDKYETKYGDLLAYLRGGLLRDGVIDSVQLEEEGLTIEYTTGDIKSFEEEKQLVNLSRRMSVGETGKRVRVGTGKKKQWRVTMQVAYYSFAAGEDVYR
jgi:hypothetical protein